MKRETENIDDTLRRSLPRAPRAQMEAALDRVYQRLRADRVWTAAEPVETAAPTRRSLLTPVLTIAAAAAVIALAIGIGISLRDGGVAVLEAADASLYRLADGTRIPVRAGEQIEARQTVQANGGGAAVFSLVDGSRVEMRSQSELAFDRVDDGLKIRLNAGSIIVNAAKGTNRRLYVETRDMTVAVTGTVSVVSTGSDGSRVGVIEGEARVREENAETRVKPSEQVSTSPTLAARPLKEAVAWSRQADAYRTILDTFERGMALSAGPLQPLRAASPNALSMQQAAQDVQFDEASIRPCDPDNIPAPPAGARGGGANSLQMTPGRLHALCLTLATIIRTAYGYTPADLFANGGRGRAMNANIVYGLGVEDGRRVRGGPDWVRSEYYTIDAVAADAADAETMRGPMLRALLERRFGLKAHIETEQIAAYDLTLARGGLKMKEGICTPRDPAEPQRAGGSTMDVVRKNLAAARRGETTAYPCGTVFAANGPNILVVGAGGGVPPLSGLFGVPINDRTAIPATARFNYVLEFSPDQAMTGPLARVVTGAGPGPDVQVAPDPSAVSRAPNIFTALEEQLGLKLEPGKAPREYIVIDQVERPTAN